MCQNSTNHLKKALISLLALSLAFACTRQEEVFSPREIHFAATMGQYEVKATDTAFDLQDSIGLSIGTPVSVNNLRLEVTENELLPERPVLWGEGQSPEQAADFYAYYPYSSTQSLMEGFEFSISSDQSKNGYTASDLMTAFVSSAPKDQMVRLPFRHRFSRLILKINNQMNSEVCDVYVGGIYGKAFVRKDEELILTGGPGIVKAGWYVLPDGESVVALVFPPQTTMPKLMITMADQKQYTYEVEEKVPFESGYSYRASITLDNDAISTDFTTEVSEWVNNADFQFTLGNFDEVLSGDDGEVYTVTGRVGTILNQSYGNFYLHDAQGQTLRVYGTLNSKGQYPKDADPYLLWMNKDFSFLPGDVVTVKGKKITQSTGVDLEKVTVICSTKQSVGIMGDVVEVGRTGGMRSFYVRLSQPDKLQIYSKDSWMDSFEGPFEYSGDWYSVRFMYDANFLDGNHNYSKRWGDIYLTDGVTQVQQGVLQGEYPREMRTLQDVIGAADNTLVKFTGIVHAVSTRSYMLYDGKVALHVYKSTNGPGCKVGDEVTTVGNKVMYQGVPEITNIEETTVLSSDNDLLDVTYQDISASFDNFASEISVPVMVKGTLSITNNKAYVTPEGASKQCYIYWYENVDALTPMVGEKVMVQGFYFGAYGNNKDVVATSVRLVEDE